MNPAVIAALARVGQAVSSAIGQTILGLLTTLLAGRTFKRILLMPIEWLAKKTGTRKDNQIVAEIRKDWDMSSSDDKRE